MVLCYHFLLDLSACPGESVDLDQGVAAPFCLPPCLYVLFFPVECQIWIEDCAPLHVATLR